MLLSVTEFVGRFHPAIVHLPIGILLIGLMLQWLSGKEKYKISQEVVKIVLLIGMFSAIISCITGYMLSMSGDYDSSLVAMHMWMGIAVAAASLLLCAKVLSGRLDITHKIASVCLLVLIVLTGHMGGSLTHGSDYLTSALKTDTDTTATVKRNIVNVQEARAYADVIQPILQTKCYSCHGAKKQKGNFRMDDTLLLMKGGKKGKELIPGKADESELIKRLLLPKEEDHHMPPREKPQLTEKQIALIHWWVDQGADFYKKVKELPQTDKIKPALLSVQSDHAEHKAATDLPAAPVAAADAKAIEALKNKNVVVLPVAEGNNYLEASFVTAYDITDKDLQLLLPLKKQLVWLRLGDTKITDQGLTDVGKCTSLTELYLNNTAITDNGLKQLVSLDSLQTLSLVGTKVTEKGLEALQKLKKLKYLYLYQTIVNKNDWNRLHQLFPKVLVDTGGYQIPFMATDTETVKPPKR